jgi:hypothetical protein
MTIVREKNGFWSVVRDCLIQFHGLTRQTARDKCQDLREKIESSPEGYSSDIFYHNEPFEIANRLAGNDLDLSKYRPKYEQILASHNW